MGGYQDLGNDEEELDQDEELIQTNARRIHFNSPERNVFCDNKISTAKYNLVTFLPKFLFEQFKRYSNVFFLFIALIQQIPEVSPTGRYTTLVPLLFILGVSAIKEIFEDYRRHRADDDVNKRRVKVFRDTFVTTFWTEVKVGEIVKVTNGQFFPADLILLSSSEPMSMAYIETANLDGETNLKIRQGLPETAHINEGSVRNVINADGYVDCELPNNRLYQFVGNIHLRGRGERPNVTMPLSPDQVLLRGAQLRNTEWVLGFVVYTGHESKVMQNSTAAPIKRSNVDRITNKQIIFLFTMLLVLSLLSAIGNYVWTHKNRKEHWYLDLTGETAKDRFLVFMTFIILYNNLIPISLTVTLEVVKFIQALFINWDLEMYDEESDTAARARTSNLNEELGQVQYIFSDKTGTLTRNIMEFRRASIAGVMYGQDAPPSHFHDPALLENLGSNHETAPFIREFLTLLSVCHTVIPERDPNNQDRIIYQASSPDEGALVAGAKQLGFSFNVRTPDSVVIYAMGKEEVYEILDVLEFNSNRKRMSVIVRKKGVPKLKLLIKGADSVIYPRLGPHQRYSDVTLEHMDRFASEGLRTLCIAEREIPEEEYQVWKKKYDEAAQALENREEAKEKVCELIEKDLFLLGATAIEDKLQEGVPEAIADFAAANIKLWVLTGDKQETAINIGYACRLLTQQMSLLLFPGTTLDECQASLSKHRTALGSDLGRVNEVAIVIDGQNLVHALSPELQLSFLEVALSCKAVICCRVTPLQKADIVRLIKKNVKAITLAIGDGANDVGMIQAAHVGVGISGQEGLQAASSSDYSIAQFRFLKKLLFVHGAWSFIRLSRVILYSFYKNIALYIMQLWFALVNGFSGQILFERWSIGMYNVIFTAFPPLVMGILDQTVSSKKRMLKPELYHSTQKGKHFNTRIFWVWIFLALYHSVTTFSLSLRALSEGTVLGDGKVVGNWFTGTAIYTVMLIVVTARAGLSIDFWPKVNYLGIWIGIPLWILYLLVYCRMWPTFDVGVNLSNVDLVLFSSGTVWFMSFIIPLIVLSLDYIIGWFRRRFSPSIEQVVMEEEEREADMTWHEREDGPFEKVIKALIIFFKRDVGMKKPRRTVLSSSEFSGQRLNAGSEQNYGAMAATGEGSDSFELHNESRPLRSVNMAKGDKSSPIPVLKSGSQRGITDDEPAQRGYAFSQSEHSLRGHQRTAVAQADLVRRYDTTQKRP